MKWNPMNNDMAIIRRWAGTDDDVDDDAGSGIDESRGLFRTVKVSNITTFSPVLLLVL